MCWNIEIGGLQEKGFNPNIEQLNQISETELKRYLVNSVEFYYLKSNENIFFQRKFVIW